jgi:hypothetical protein
MVFSHSRNAWLILVTTFLFSLISFTSVSASSVQLQWDANTEADLAGYRVYHNMSPYPLAGSVPLDVGMQTTATISGLDPYQTYSFALTAYNTAGEESSFSNIVTLADQATSISGSTNLTVADALLALQIGSGKIVPTPLQLTRLDVAPVLFGSPAPDGKIDTGDAIVILSKVVGTPAR